MITTISGDPEKSSAEVGPSAQKMSDPDAHQGHEDQGSDSAEEAESEGQAEQVPPLPCPQEASGRHRLRAGCRGRRGRSDLAWVSHRAPAPAWARCRKRASPTSQQEPHAEIPSRPAAAGRSQASRPGSRSGGSCVGVLEPRGLRRAGADSYTEIGLSHELGSRTSVLPLTPVTSICTVRSPSNSSGSKVPPKPPR